MQCHTKVAEKKNERSVKSLSSLGSKWGGAVSQGKEKR